LGKQRAAAVEAVERQLGAAMRNRGEPESAVGGDAPIRLEVVPDLVAQRLGVLLGPPADELGANWVIGLTEEAAVGTSTGQLADALAAEGEREHQVARHGGPSFAPGGVPRPVHVIDD